MKPTLTRQQAMQQADNYITQVLSVLPPTQLEDLSPGEPRACDDPTDNGPKGRVTVARSFFLRGLPKKTNAANIDKVRQWALAHNFRILDDIKQPDQFLWMENKRDGFRVTISESADDSKTMSLDVGSPCVWPNGTPEPKPQGLGAGTSPAEGDGVAAAGDFGAFDPARFASKRTE